MPNEMNSPSMVDGFHLVVDVLKLNGNRHRLWRRGYSGTESGHLQNLNPQTQVGNAKRN
jgi:hypothetical protein